jgi:hypothetical protein
VSIIGKNYQATVNIIKAGERELYAKFVEGEKRR